jgi:hypothetical protein
MATRMLESLHRSGAPDTTGECWYEPFPILATNDVWGHMIARFGASNAAAPTVRHGFWNSFRVPSDYVGSAVIRIVWTATLTTGDVVWDFEYRTVNGNDVNSLDQAGTEQSVTVTDTAPGAALRQLEVTIALTATNFSVGDEVEFGLFRDGADAADTMAGSAILQNLVFEYSDT